MLINIKKPAKWSVLLFSLFVIGCSDGGDSTDVVTKDYQLFYNADYTAIDGNVKISIDNIVNSPNMSQSVEVKSFIVKAGDCPMETYTVTPDPVIFTENTTQDLAIHVDFAGQCFGDILTLTADKVVTTTYPNVNTTDISESIWSETYDLKSETGGEVESPVTTGAGFIQFVSATPQNIALLGTGSAERPETSIVVFKVVDENANPSPNMAVTFELTTTIGGLSLINESAQSDSDGLVQVVVKAGTVATHVRVIATLTATSDTAISDELVVSTGIPDQDSFSICISSGSLFNPEAWEYNGETVSVTILAADSFNNPVPDGLAIYFTTEGGAIEPSCTTVNGSCAVEWRSQNPRPDNGRVTILATAIGEESFTDVNGNGSFDLEDKEYWDIENASQGVPCWLLVEDDDPCWYLTCWYLKGYDDLPDAFRDDNKNGVYDYGEEFFDFDENDECKGNYIYNGLLCTDEAEALGICTKELVHVRDDIVLVMSGSYAVININPSPVDLTGGGKTVDISVADCNDNSMLAGTTVDVETTNGTIVGETSFEVLNTTEPLKFEVTLEPSEGDENTGILTVTVTTPKGHETTESIIVID
ncbi:MAG: hypothetical protein GQ559_04260 [Desulfobulbaceae bacterium]|nr:hypothetical protein [Desulfobulbaceae bacterium]